MSNAYSQVGRHYWQCISNYFMIFSTVKFPSINFNAIKFHLPTRGTRDDYMYDGTFHEAVGSILAVAQLFGIMPVHGIKAKNPSQLRFKILSFRFLFSIIYIVGSMLSLCLTVHWIATSKLEFGKLINFTFEFTNLVALICFLDLGRKWPMLMISWYRVEKCLPQLKYQFDKQKMAYQIKMASLVILFSSLSEYFELLVWLYACIAGQRILNCESYIQTYFKL